MSVWSQGQRPAAPPSSCWSDWRGTCPSLLVDGYGDECQDGGGEREVEQLWGEREQERLEKERQEEEKRTIAQKVEDINMKCKEEEIREEVK